MSVPYEKLVAKAHMMRADYEALMHSVTHPHVDVAEYREIELSLVAPYITKLLVYRPLGSDGKVLPAYISLHSGAWARGSAYFDDYVNRVTANRVGCVVVAVEFQLAPEAQFPTQPNECYSAVKWVFDHAGELGVDTSRIALGGHNSGGTLAIAVANMAKVTKAFDLCCVISDCAMMDLSCDYDELPDFDLDEALVGELKGAFFNTCYLGSLSKQTDPLASPKFGTDVSGLPPIFMVCAELDPTAGDAEDYYNRLKAAGNDCRFHCHLGQKHGFNVQPGLAPQEKVDESFLVLDNYLIEKFAK